MSHLASRDSGGAWLLDQAALLDALNVLYGLYLPLLSVKHLGNE